MKLKSWGRKRVLSLSYLLLVDFMFVSIPGSITLAILLHSDIGNLYPSQQLNQNIPQIYYILKVWYWHVNGHMDQWMRIERPEIIPRINSQLIFDKDTKNLQWGKDGFFNKRFWRNWMFIWKIMNLYPYFTPLIKFNSNWIKNLSVKSEAIKFLEGNTWGKPPCH